MRKEVYVDISARHVHLRPQDVETLFGPGAELTLRGQDNFMGGSVYTQRVEIQGPKGSIPKVTICRAPNQVYSGGGFRHGRPQAGHSRCGP